MTPMTTSRVTRRSTLGAVLAASLLAAGSLAGCSQSAATSSAPSSASATGAHWPVAVSVDGTTVTVPAEPTRIVAITSETGDLALKLAGPSRMAAISANSQLPAMGTATDLAKQVPNTLPSTTDPDPEKVLSYQPDLIVSTLRHDGEKAANQQLEASGVPVISLNPSDFTTPEGIESAIGTLGRALGEQNKATQLSDQMSAAMKAVDAERGANHPTTLCLMARGNSVMAMGDDQMLPGLVKRGGGTNAGAAVDLTQTRAVDAELIAKANPQIIFLEDFMGTGNKPFASLLANQAVAQVPAVANKQIYLIPMTQASSISGTQTPDGYRTIVDDLKKSS